MSDDDTDDELEWHHSSCVLHNDVVRLALYRGSCLSAMTCHLFVYNPLFEKAVMCNLTIDFVSSHACLFVSLYVRWNCILSGCNAIYIVLHDQRTV